MKNRAMIDRSKIQFDLIKLIGIERYIQLNSAPAPEQEEGGDKED